MTDHTIYEELTRRREGAKMGAEGDAFNAARRIEGGRGSGGADGVECRMAGALAEIGGAVDEVMVMPAGQQKISASQGGRVVEVLVRVDRETARALQGALEAHLVAGPQRPWFDFDHAKGPASAWPLEFVWRDGGSGGGAGVYARVEWSAAGRQAVEGKMYRAFSPVFHVDDVKGRPARVVGAPLNMGGLVNDPAFREISPLWAANKQETQQMSMKSDEGTAPNAANAGGGDKGNVAGQGAAAPPEGVEARASDGEVEALRAKVARLEGEMAAARRRRAAEAVEAAVARGAIPAKAVEIQGKWRERIEGDAAVAELLEGLPGTGVGRAVTASVAGSGDQAVVTREDSQRVLLAYAQEVNPKARGVIYAREISPRIRAGEDFSLGLRPELALQAANSLGTLAGDIVVQRALEILRLQFPVLSSITTDFREVAAQYGQVVKSRIIGIPSVTSYNTSTGYASSDATATDVPVTINADKAVQIEFNNQELGSTARSLFEEQAEAMAYALAKDLVDAVYALITAGNFTATATTQAVGGFARPTVIAMGKALTDRGVPMTRRTLLLNTSYYAKLAEDTTVVAIANNADAARSITTGKLPDLHGFGLVEAPNLPGTGNLTGFGLFPSALVVATRLPDDYTKVLPGVTGGAVTQVVTDPNSGASVLKVMFVDHLKARAYGRMGWQYGVAKGDVNAGQRLISS